MSKIIFEEVENERKERLRKMYIKVLYTVTTYRKALAELTAIFSSETRQQRDERISAYIGKANADLEMLEVELMLEKPDDNVLNLMRKAQDSCIFYAQKLKINEEQHATYSIKELESEKKNADEAIEKLRKFLSEELVY